MHEPHEHPHDLITSNGVKYDENDEDASEAQARVIDSLRAQVTDLFSQVTQLNSKLVSSYDRVSDLEDQLHDTSASLRNSSVTISSLELERSHHLAALNTGLLVEKAHVTTELNRLMERATEEAAQRGQAESARQDIEKDLDDLSATLFDQANNMVAEARLGRARSERKVLEAENALKIAEDAVKVMQIQMQTLQAEKEAAEREAQEARVTVGKGKWVERDELRVWDVPKVRFMTTHAPYAEFIAFVTHLRGLKTSQPTPPIISSLLGQPFLARLFTEDSEPTVRLDLAPSLNWLSRRAVLTAIHTGMLTVEPMAFSNLLQEPHLLSQSQSSTAVSCALCGTPIARLPTAAASVEKPPSHPKAVLARSSNTNGNSWFRYPLALSSSQNNGSHMSHYEPPGQVYIFRLAVATTPHPPPVFVPVHAHSASTSHVGGVLSRSPVHTAVSSRVLPAQTQNLRYPLCTSNYCLFRLRSTCSLWAFVRTGIVERIWEEVAQPPKSSANLENDSVHVQGHEASTGPTTPASAVSQPSNATVSPPASEKPPVPPRRRGLWEMASAFGERAVSWGKEGVEGKDDGKKLPILPPAHPSAPHPHADAPAPLDGTQVPPPLPKRRDPATTDTTVPEPDNTPTQNGTAAPVTAEPYVYRTNNIHDLSDPGKVDRNASNDSFSTPVDEITFALPILRQDSPSAASTHHAVSVDAVATLTQDHLPPSSPRTVTIPQTPTSPVPRVTSPVPRSRSRVTSRVSPPPTSRVVASTASRSRAGSPAPVNARAISPPPVNGPVRTSTSSPLVSSRTGSPAPGHGAPPVPRRAAARRAVPPPPPGVTPVEQAKEGEGESAAAAVAIVPLVVAGARKDGEESGQSQRDALKHHTTPVFAPDKIMDSATAAPENVTNTSSAGGVDTQASSAARPPETLAAPYPPKVPVDSEAPAERLSTDTDVPPIEKTLAGRTSGDSSVHTSIDSTSTKRSSSTDGEGFASDVTWEERTWKEVVKLKEEMFWARIGGVRQL
ncbi:hypothetical protein PAXRUDRAFT_148685 [Paxillus rubicundulus Ve08.2h10]|uniref:GDP/GTP exchange factor Sec2 N-terminal domain-containing protein n=1 Tax=Paxillus rubicundulus Ve08.2h10 TaxID=930991 RepID=A0A0D0DYN4_9AGAM|nr:hypothetical protein PAXRUDRAFT_148685 [Paxillus rubicundulus Ve08.2h10]